MHKVKWIKVTIVLLFIIVAGILYSCRVNQRETVNLLTDTEENLVINENTNNFNDTESLEEEAADKDQSKDMKSDESTNSFIYVHICGEVLKPDVYKVEMDTRVVEVIALAGGLTSDAAGDYINQAAPVSDGQQIYIPSLDEAALSIQADFNNALSSGINVTDKENNLVNINTASADELMTLSGIGQAKAQAIIEYRDNSGGFKAIEEIKNIEGIKDAVFNKIKDKIRIK